MKRSGLIAVILSVTGCQEHSLPVSPVGQVPLLQTGAPTSRTNMVVSLNYSFFSSCTGEFLLVTGKLHVVTTVWNNSDQLRIQSHLNANLAAKGLTSGLNYRLLQITNQQYESSWNTGTAESDHVFIFMVTSATAAQNFSLTMNGTWRYGANGSVTIEPKKWESVCR